MAQYHHARHEIFRSELDILVAELAGLDAFLDQDGDKRANLLQMLLDSRPLLLDGDDDHLVNLLLVYHGLERDAVLLQYMIAQPLGGTDRAPGIGQSHLITGLEHAFGKSLVDIRLGREETVDVGRRHAKLTSDVRDIGLGVAVVSEQPLRRIEDTGDVFLTVRFDGLSVGFHLGSAFFTCDEFHFSSALNRHRSFVNFPLRLLRQEIHREDGTKLDEWHYDALPQGCIAGCRINMLENSGIPLMNEERYRLLIEAITEYAIYMLDVEGRVASWNPGARRFKGYDPDEILGEHFSRFYTEEDQSAGLPQRALETAATEGRFENQGWRVRKDGSRFWAHVVIDPIRDSSGRLAGFAKVTRDLTERKQTETELKGSEQKFQLLVQGVTDYALYMLDPEGYVTNWNVGAERIKGYTADEIVGCHFSQFYTEEDRLAGEPQKSLDTARREGRIEREGLRQRKDGTRFWAHVIIDAIHDERGELIGFAKITRDVTEKMEAQKALNQAREELFQAQKMEAIGQLTGGIAHDFNNLLMAILGSLQILRKRMPNDPSLSPLVDNAIQGAERGAALTQRMLAFSRRQDLNMQAVDIPALVTELMDFMQRSLGSTVRIETRLAEHLAHVMTDPVQLETALLNLVVNARDAMPGGGAIIIEAREIDIPARRGSLKPGRYVELSVADTGEGMDEETLIQATTPFFTTKGVGKGTGLGLSMVQGLTEQSGGKLAIESRKGEGTKVSLFLPSADTPASSQPAEAAASSVAVPRKQLTVLAVDDDALVLMNTTLMLEDLGHQVIEAYSGVDALNTLRNGDNRIDLVITDHSMPRMSGSELAAEIQAQWPDLPIVLATGYAELPSGGDNRLPRLGKPFSQDQLQDVITTVLCTKA